MIVEAPPVPPPARRGWVRPLLAVLAAVALLLLGAAVGLLVGLPGSSATSVPGADSVDVGFAQDMIVHHSQGVLMSHYAELDTEDPDIGLLAYDINYTQTAQIGQMQGWLALWDMPQISSQPHMAWMTSASSTSAGHDMGGMAMTSGATTAGSQTTGADAALMPGMATQAEMNKLKSLHGKESDIYFLQLMIRHHQGGAPMMAYAQQHATTRWSRTSPARCWWRRRARSRP